MVIPRALADELIEHARRDYPDECCGLLAIADGSVTRLYPAENIHHSPERFEIDGRVVMQATEDIEARGSALGLYHSHTKSAAYPSQTDVNFAELWPGTLWLIVSLAKRDSPDLRAFWINGPKIDEVDLTVE